MIPEPFFEHGFVSALVEFDSELPDESCGLMVVDILVDEDDNNDDISLSLVDGSLAPT